MLPIIIAGVGAALSAYNAYKTGKDNAEQARRNAYIASQNASIVTQTAESDIGRHKLKVGQLEGQQRSALAASGVVADQGSALDIQTQTAAMATLDELTMRANAQREAWGIKMQGQNFINQANAYDSAAVTGAFSELVSGGMRVYGAIK